MPHRSLAKFNFQADRSESCRRSRAGFRFVPFSAKSSQRSSRKGHAMLTETQKDTLRECHTLALKYLHKEFTYEEFQTPLEDMQLHILELLLDHDLASEDGKTLDLAYKLANTMGQQDPADCANSVHTLASYLERALGIV